MYEEIRSKSSVVKKFQEELEKTGVMSSKKTDRMKAKLIEHLNEELAVVESGKFEPSTSVAFEGQWAGFGQAEDMMQVVPTGIELDTLTKVGIASIHVPEGFVSQLDLRLCVL